VLTSCPHRPPCPGCPRFGVRGIDNAARSALYELAHAHGLADVAVVSGETQAFRLRARLAIRGRVGAPRLGLFELGTHRLVHIPNCSVQHPLINHVASIVRGSLIDAHVPSYSDTAQLGLARYLQVVVERSSQTAQVVLVANSATPEPLAACLDLIRERLGSDLHSLWLNSQCEPTNVILGPAFHRWSGPPGVIEHFGGAAVHYPPGAFGQSNLEIAERIVGHVRAQVPAGARVTEFYCGTGAIGLSLLAQAAHLRMNEVSAQSLQGLQAGLADLDPADRARIVIVPGPAGEACAAADDAQIVIVDPPRKGLDPALTQYLAHRPPERLLYVSCGLESFLADVARLSADGRLRLTGLTAFNLMPFTAHVETVARFDRT
jgi:tRNA/tmRNA/rRNA uracil-C5-methylase (TrmA/RlmC/RlmD family)